MLLQINLKLPKLKSNNVQMFYFIYAWPLLQFTCVCYTPIGEQMLCQKHKQIQEDEFHFGSILLLYGQHLFYMFGLLLLLEYVPNALELKKIKLLKICIIINIFFLTVYLRYLCHTQNIY